jgi:hypothetical protein
MFGIPLLAHRKMELDFLIQAGRVLLSIPQTPYPAHPPHGLPRENWLQNRVLKGHDFTGCGKTRGFERARLQPCRKSGKISDGFSR